MIWKQENFTRVIKQLKGIVCRHKVKACPTDYNKFSMFQCILNLLVMSHTY